MSCAKYDADDQGPNFDYMPSFFTCVIDYANQYNSLGYGAQAPKIVIFSAFYVIWSCFEVLGHF